MGSVVIGDQGSCDGPSNLPQGLSSWLAATGLVRRVVPHRRTPLPAGDREVPPDGPVRMQCLGARAVGPLPGHQHTAGPCPSPVVERAPNDGVIIASRWDCRWLNLVECFI
jgi:hypothetical protein